MPSGGGGALRQGEILHGACLHVVPIPASASPDDPYQGPIIEQPYPMLMVMHSDCDLEQDFNRYVKDGVRLIPQVVCCMAAPHDDESGLRKAITSLGWSPDRVVQNLWERLHYLHRAAEALPILCDFRELVAIPTTQLYEAIDAGGITRGGVLKSPWREDVVRRFHNYLSRVAGP